MSNVRYGDCDRGGCHGGRRPVIGLDTNVLVRYIAQDDPDQSARATALIESLDEDNRGFVSTVALVELHWVLRRAYKVTRTNAAAIVQKLLESQELTIQEPDVIRRLSCTSMTTSTSPMR